MEESKDGAAVVASPSDNGCDRPECPTVTILAHRPKAIKSANKEDRKKAEARFKDIIDKVEAKDPEIKNALATPGYFQDRVFRLTALNKKTILHQIVDNQDDNEDDDDDNSESSDNENNADDADAAHNADGANSTVKEDESGNYHEIDGENNELLEILVKGIVQNHPDMLLSQDKNQTTPLQAAIDCNCIHLVEWMCSTEHKELSSAISTEHPSKKTNCLHKAMTSPKLPINIILKMIEISDKKAIEGQNLMGLTPLHLAMQYENCQREKWDEVVKALITKNEGALDIRGTGPEAYSVIRYHDDDRYKPKKMEKYRKRKAKKIADSQPTSNVDMQPSAPKRRGTNLGNAEPAVESHVNEPAQPPKLDDWKNFEKRKERQSVKKDRDEPKSRHEPNKEISVKLQEGITPQQKAERLESKADDIRDFIKLHYFRTYPVEKITDWLFADNIAGTQIDFDLFEAGADDNVVKQFRVKEFCDVYEHFEFDSVLKSVHFRSLHLTGTEKYTFRDNHKFVALKEDNGCTDITFLFDWLWHSKGVRRIMNVTMEDRQQPHSDEAIERCLERFRVESLDWQKIDLCPGVIATVGSHLRNISLHWSGHNAVLRGWGEPEGLSKCPQLQSITLHFDSAFESSQRIKANIDSFSKRLSANRKGADRHIDVTNYENTDEQLSKQSNPSPISINAEGSNQNTEKWLKCIDKFADKINGLERDIPKLIKPSTSGSLLNNVVVAVIDDGIDIWEKDLQQGRIAGGKSFDMDTNSANIHYRISARGHGTTMAKMIVRVCPVAKIYVLKIETHEGGGGGGATIDPLSAAQAIQAAVDRNVDIISMSWSVKKPNDSSPEKSKFDEALKNAISKGILLFCSSGDEGNLETETYPGAYQGGNGKIFKIGAARATGKVDDGTPHDAYTNYLLPGHNIRDRDSGNSQGQPYNGSSISTALAAGLAALVRHCVRVGVLWTNSVGAEERDRYGIRVQQSDFDDMRDQKMAPQRMEAAFNKFCLNEVNRKYLEIWRILERPKLDWKGLLPEERIREIADLGQILCRKPDGS